MDDRTFDEPSAREWIEVIESTRPSPRDLDIYPRLNAWIERTQPASILEIGAGQGICSDKISLVNRSYIGVEPSPYLLARATERYPNDNRRFLEGSAYALPCADQSIEAAFSVAVWHLLSDLPTAARELRRVLSGSFLIITANPAAYGPWMERYTETQLDGTRFEGRTRHADGTVSIDVLYLHTLDEITASLHAAGLRTRSIETFRTVNNQDLFIAIEG